MILNMMELWVECDKYATTFYPLLLQYGTGFPAQILHPLILPKWEQLLRLAAVEDYVQGRADHQPGPPPWEWAQQGNLTENSFPLRFYEGSPTLKSFREQVNARTEEMKQKKMREWDEKMRNYDRLRCQLKNDKREHWRSATSRWRRSIWIDECEQNCPRCAFENGIRSQIEGLRIQVFHEPLPEDDLLSKTMVYEMLVPEIIQSWRDATLHILVTLAGREAKTKRRAEFYYPESHSIIEEVLERPDFVSCLDGRFRVASEVDDSDEEAKFVEIEDANEDSIIEKHRYCYDIYDTDYSRRSVSDIPELVHQAASSSTYFYPPSTMAEPSLKRWICDTSHSLNDVIASQSDCPDSMRLDEFKAFGSMRAGIALQWPNILMQLAVPVIGFNKLETLYLILQAANQAGPRNDAGPHRVAHSWLADEAFGLALIDKLEDAFTGIQDNWECHIVWCLVLSLVLRLLSLSPSHFVADRCLACLANVRERSIEASLELRKKLEKTDRDMERKDISQRALVMALVCHGTFDVGAERLRAMILEVDASEHPPTAHWLLESSMIIAENVSTRESYQGDRLLVILLHRWRSLSVAVEPLLREAIACDSSCYNCLDMAIRDVWDGYGERQTLWSCPSRQHVHVMASDSPTAQSEKLHRLQYNLLTGSLLINGEPLFIMPSDIQSHATYKRLFGDIILRVAPSTLPGMKFQASHLGHQVHFGMIENELIIRSLKDGLDSELIPASKLAKRFPKLLLSNYTHWLVHTERERDAETKVQSDTYEIIQFRSTRNTWEASKDSQVLYLQLGKDGYGHLRTAWNGNKELEHVGMRSMTATVISDIFRSIEYPEYIHLTLDSEKSKLNIHLPRYQASFSLDYGEDAIRSDQYVDLIVDEDQSLGTLHGLQSRMVLRSKENRGSLAARAVLVPEGQPFFVKERIGYASVYLVPDRTESSIKYHFYYVKELLGFLKGPGTLRSELYLCYLHAVTSHVLPDALTGYTGTERALQILRSDTVSSLARAASAGFGNDVQLLRQIASLSPSRAYFRIPGRRIQSIVWSDVPALAQSDELYVATQEIMNEVLDFESCFPLGLEGLKPLDHSEDSLVKRAIARTSGNDSEKSYEDRDREYGGRNTPAGLETAKLARRLVTLLSDHKPDQLTEQILPSSILNLTQALGCRIPESPGLVYPNYSSSKPQVSDMVGLPRELQLGFDIRWLGLSSVTLRSSWTRLHEWLYQSNMVEEDCGDKYDIMMLFATLCFASGMDSQIMQILLCFAISPGARPRQLEHWEHATATSVPLELTHGAVLDESKLNSLAEEFARDFEYTPGDSSWYRSGVSAEDRRSQRLKFQAAQDKCVEKLLDELKNQGLCENPTITNPSSYAKYISINKFMDEVRILFRSWLRNKQHVDYLRRVIAAAEGFKVLTSTDEDSIPARLIWRYPTPQGFKGLTLTYLLAHSSPPQISAVVPTAFGEFLERREPYKLQSQTKQLLGDLKNIDDSEHPHREVYRKELSASVESLLSSRHGPPSLGADTDGKWLRGELDTHLRICEENVTQMTQSIITLLSRMPYATDQNVAWYPLWPRITTRSLLEQLSHRRWESPELPGFWKQALVEYAKAITTNQRAQRLVRLFARAKWKDLAKEIQNVGHQGWDPLEFPEYLLFEVENELLIRPVQYDIAHEMRRDSGGNAIMQLNMGEGKSSVIVPIVAAGLANGKRVVRVIVTRPQFKQMIHALCTKLGGLLGRQIYTLPFSRQLKPSVEQVQKIAAKAREYAVQGGVLLVQLEHILSMELLGLEAVLSGKDKEEALGKAILQGRVYFEKHAWDIVDESDDIFDAGFELTYTMGSQKTIEYGPQRWQLIQATLEVVQRAIANLQREAHGDGDNASLGNHLQKFGTLDESTVPLLLETVARSMLLGKHEGLTSIPRLSKESRESLLRYMTYPRPTAEDISVMEGVFPNDHDQWPLLLLRGLFAGGVLEFSLRKRWRVNAGLFHDRSPATGLAVPYHAKDFPAPRAEFSHPDVVIILTCLSYYYEGLSDETLEAVFKRLLASDQGETEYINWVRVDRDRLPKTLGGVNLKDRTSCEKIFSILRHNKNVVDYYLSNMLFPREMKEFTKKLSASGWNIAGDRRRPLRGFSGTKDSKSLLPWSIEFKDLDEQQHTNASVLDCVFREENCIRVLGLDAHHTVDSLLQSVVDHKEDIHVILDVGAQFLESNVHVARAWLAKVAPDVAEAVITFSDSHELIVVPRNGDPELFRLTSYYENTEGCLVFLDEAHTRGTDLILPDYYRAAVMIGPQLPKDKLVQGERV
jgi:hypothetical protein